ncbi:hypothetical protein [Streptosporangium amethystogenes]|uniref:hypothetical protein n=1 Tax=Streptosporangium amethystogenes TaxID=2002 RepID=UPI003CCBF2EA
MERLGAYRDPFAGQFIVPSERTFRRVLADLDANALDTAISSYCAMGRTRPSSDRGEGGAERSRSCSWKSTAHLTARVSRCQSRKVFSSHRHLPDYHAQAPDELSGPGKQRIGEGKRS